MGRPEMLVLALILGLDQDLAQSWDGLGSTGTQEPQLVLTTTEPGLETTEPGLETTEPGLETTEPGLETTEPGLETTEPGLNSTYLGEDEEDLSLAEPVIYTHVNSETVIGTHFQTVSCLAIGGRPAPEVSWLVSGLPPSQDIFTVGQTETPHPNKTSSISSTLHFPTHLNDQERVTCVVKHPTFTEPLHKTTTVDTFVSPNISLTSKMVGPRGGEVWLVSCVSSEGRPEPSLTLTVTSIGALHTQNHTQTHLHLPVSQFEGHSVTCVVHHPKFTSPQTRIITLPTLYLEAELVSNRSTEHLELTEGQRDVVIRINVTGNVPSYNSTCTKDGGGLPDGMELVNTDLSVDGPVSPLHSGLYQCVFSFHRHTAALYFNITVKILPVAPLVHIDFRTEGGGSVIECSAANAVPEAEVSWVLPESLAVVPQYNVSSQDGTFSVLGRVLLPPCLPRELTAHCLINHPAFEETNNRSVKIPVCARPNITLLSRPEWRGAEAYTVVQCSVDSVSPAVSINWTLVDGEGHSSVVAESSSERELRSDGTVSTLSSVEVLSSVYSGQRLSCVVDHLSLEEPEERSLIITHHKAPVLRASVGRLQGSSLWRAECVCSGERVSTNLSWLLPPHLHNHTSVDSYSEGQVETVRLTYLFPLSVHEGQDLSCVHHSLHGLTQTTTVHVPLYTHPNITLLSRPEWREAEAYTVVQCSVDSVSPAASINWTLVDGEGHSSVVAESSSERELQSDGTVSTLSSVEVLSSVYSGQRLSCVVDHLSLEEPEERSLIITHHKAPVLIASVGRPQGSSLWRADCVCSGEGVGTNLSWLLPPHLHNHTSINFYSEGDFSLDSYSEGSGQNYADYTDFYSESQKTVRLTYLFPLSVHEGQDLSCVHHSLHGLTQTSTVHVPLYYLSLKVVNHTTLLHTTGVHKLSLHEGQPDQRILLQVEGNTSVYTLTCHRSDGSPVHTEGTALVFPSELTAPDEGLYTCHAHFYHHTASVSIQVEINRQEQQISLLMIICISSALAFVLILTVVHWVFCKVKSRKKCKKQECVSALASLVQDPDSPVTTESVIILQDGKEYSQLDNYSIVIDVKSAV